MNINNTYLTQKNIRIILLIISMLLITGISVLLAFLGNTVYRNSAEGRACDELNDASSYLLEQLKGCEDSTQIRCASVSGKLPALVISSGRESEGRESEGRESDSDSGRGGDGSSEVWYFVYDGQLRSVSINAGETVSPESGQPVAKLAGADFHMTAPGLLELTLESSSGDSSTFNLYLAGSGGENNE